MYNGRVREIFEKVGNAKTVNEVYLLLAEQIGYSVSTDDPSFLLPHVLVYKADDDQSDVEIAVDRKIFDEIWSTPVGDTRLIARKNDTLTVEHKFGLIPNLDVCERRYFEIRIVSL